MWKSQRHTCTLCIIWITYTRKIWIRFPHVPCKPPIMTGNLGISHLNRHWEWIFQSVKSYLNWSSVRTLSSGPSEHLKYLSQSLPAPGAFPKPKRDSDFTPTSTWQTPPTCMDNIILENVNHFYLPWLRKRVFEDQDIQTKTKLHIYQATDVPSLLYGAENLTTYSRHTKTLEQYHLWCLRKILQISWEERWTNVSILKESNKPSITTTNHYCHQMPWMGRVIRMPNTQLPKQVL